MLQWGNASQYIFHPPQRPISVSDSDSLHLSLCMKVMLLLCAMHHQHSCRRWVYCLPITQLLACTTHVFAKKAREGKKRERVCVAHPLPFRQKGVWVVCVKQKKKKSCRKYVFVSYVFSMVVHVQSTPANHFVLLPILSLLIWYDSCILLRKRTLFPLFYLFYCLPL